MKLKITVLYPDILNMYGDAGNISSFCYRLNKRGMESEVERCNSFSDIDFSSSDIIYIGGSNQRGMDFVCKELCNVKNEFKSYAENGGSILAVSGGNEILGQYYISDSKNKIPSLEITDSYCEKMSKRHIGNIILESNLTGGKIVGFENHSGKIITEDDNKLGKVIFGFGNGDMTEGIVYKNVLGTYLHGPLLPKNPKLCDYIISNALERRYGKCELEDIDDKLENEANEYIVKRFTEKNK